MCVPRSLGPFSSSHLGSPSLAPRSQVFLTHDSSSGASTRAMHSLVREPADLCPRTLTAVRRAHNSGRNHLSNVRDYYASASSALSSISRRAQADLGPRNRPRQRARTGAHRRDLPQVRGRRRRPGPHPPDGRQRSPRLDGQPRFRRPGCRCTAARCRRWRRRRSPEYVPLPPFLALSLPCECRLLTPSLAYLSCSQCVSSAGRWAAASPARPHPAARRLQAWALRRARARTARSGHRRGTARRRREDLEDRCRRNRTLEGLGRRVEVRLSLSPRPPPLAVRKR